MYDDHRYCHILLPHSTTPCGAIWFAGIACESPCLNRFVLLSARQAYVDRQKLVRCMRFELFWKGEHTFPLGGHVGRLSARLSIHRSPVATQPDYPELRLTQIRKALRRNKVGWIYITYKAGHTRINHINHQLIQNSPGFSKSTNLSQFPIIHLKSNQNGGSRKYHRR